MPLVTHDYDSEEIKKQKDPLRDFLIWMRDNDLRYRNMDFYDKNYLLNDEPVTIDEIIKTYNDEL